MVVSWWWLGGGGGLAVVVVVVALISGPGSPGPDPIKATKFGVSGLLCLVIFAVSCQLRPEVPWSMATSSARMQTKRGVSVAGMHEGQGRVGEEAALRCLMPRQVADMMRDQGVDLVHEILNGPARHVRNAISGRMARLFFQATSQPAAFSIPGSRCNELLAHAPVCK